MTDKHCSACERLKEENLNVWEYGIGDKECESLQEDTGFNPDLKVLHNDCEDLHDLNDCFIAQKVQELPKYDDCDWKAYAKDFGQNAYNVFKGIICAICGIWKKIHLIIDVLKDNDGYVTVVKTYEFTVPVNKFVPCFNPKMYWSGSPDVGECFISIPVKEMDLVDIVTAQPQVVGNQVHAVTVAIQSSIHKGEHYEVNFDTYEIEGNNVPGAPPFPFSVPIKFIVVGRKKIKGL
ncbi:hypothetical protein [Enterococcus sp. DIV0800]|uniref:hypothetical protein n=1 Tax=unclassified Enterococcus TaxID=2608891 RepID=UPI003D2FAB18